jgi:chromosome segregation ATPase
MSRRIEALQEAAAKKALEAYQQVEQALERMVRQNQKINFQTVARSANVSPAYLYQSEEFKGRIETLREQQKNLSKPQKAPSASDNSKNVIINALREANKRLKEEITELRRANEALIGRLYQVQSSHDLSEHLQRENESLKQQVKELTEQLQVCESKLSQKITPIPQAKRSRTNISERIKNQLDAAGIQLNPTLAKVIKSADEETVLDAIEAYKEALATVNIERPGGWLKKAIEEGWKPNDTVQAKSELETFNQWFPLARQKGIVMASQKGMKGIEICTNDGEWVPFAEMLESYPLDTL